jgi:transcriptional regulator with GAF, ATPase, and Fis domain
MPESQTDQALLKMFAELGFLAGTSMIPALRLAYKASCVSDVTVLLEGETGTGKQVLAEAIHRLDAKRRSYRFVTVHCCTISETLAESELFGHHRGAFSGATSDRKGLFKAAHQGTLLLDDVNDLPLQIQPKLLDVLQRRLVRPLGSDRENPVNVRLIAACNEPLEPLVRLNRFRADLYHRLNVVTIRIPPLRERRADVRHLLLAFAKRHSDLYPGILGVDDDILNFMQSLSFPGNVRELENMVQRMLFVKSEGTILRLSDWFAGSSGRDGKADADFFADAAAKLWSAISLRGVSYASAIREVEKRLLQTALSAFGGTRRDVARRLNTSERTLYHKLKKHGLGPSV